MHKSIGVLCLSVVCAWSMDVSTLIGKMEQAEKIPFSESLVRQEVITPEGDKREFEIQTSSRDDGEKNLSVYLKPARAKGEKILSLNDGDDIWTFSPKTKRVRHLATHMKKAKMMGSDFSYEDMGGGKIAEKYTVKIQDSLEYKGAPTFVVEMIPTAKGPSYKKVLSWVDANTYLPAKMEFYDESGLLKTLELTEKRKVDNRWVMWKMVMINKQEGGKTIMETLSMDLKKEPPAWMFTQEGLKKE